MSKKNEAWGVEVGAQAIKVMKLARSGSGVALEDFEVLPFKHILTTPDLNVEEAIRVNLEALAQKHEFDKSTVVVSVPGHMAFARFAKLPPIEASKVKSIVAYEAQQQIPFPIEEVEWDYQVFAQDDAPDIEVGIFAITKERVANFLSNYRSVGMRVDTLTLSPVAVYNAFAYDNSDKESDAGGNSVYLDIGTVSTDIIVVEDGGIWLRTLPLGGNHFTNALMKQFKISFAKAEKLKLEAGTSKYAKQIFQAMRGVFSDLVSEIQRSLGFYQSLNRDADLTRIVGVGSTWKLPGLQKYLKQNLQMEVVRPDGFSRLEVDGRRAAEFSSIAVNMATAYGLALQGLSLGSVDANVLPQTILRQRMWKSKQPWFGAAAACVAVAPLIAGTALLMRNSSFNTAWSESTQRNINETIGDAKNYKTRYDDEVVANDPRPGIRNFRRSFDYTNMLPKLMEDISSAMATIEPNPELKDVDWNNPEEVARVAKIDRDKRDLIKVTDIITQYKMPAGTSDDAAEEDLSVTDVTIDEFGDGGYDPSLDSGGEFSDFTGGEFGGGEVNAPAGLTPIPFPELPEQEQFESVEGEPEIEAEEPDLSALPRIIVTVRGETTMTTPVISRLLEQKFEKWLADNAERADRPYIIVADLIKTDYKSMGSVVITGGTGGVSGFDEGGGTGSIRPTPFPKDNLGGIGGLGGPGAGLGGIDGLGGTGNPLDGLGGGTVAEQVQVKTPEGWYTKIGGTSGGFSVDALLPRRPLSAEDNTKDTQFTFSFEVILLPPDEARKTILPAKPKDPETENGSNPTPGSSASTNDQQEQDS